MHLYHLSFSFIFETMYTIPLLKLYVNIIISFFKLFYSKYLCFCFNFDIIYLRGDNMDKPTGDFKARFNKAISKQNIKPIELSEKTGISKSAISHYMSGYTKPKSDKLYALSKALNVSEAWLMGYDVPMERSSDLNFSVTSNYDASNWLKHTSNEQELLNHFSKLNLKGEEEAIKRVKELIYVPDYTENQEEWLIQTPGTRKLEKLTDNTENDDSANTITHTGSETVVTIYDLLDIDSPSMDENTAPYLVAARNDHLDEEGEIEKVKSDLAKLKKPNGK
ncbi:helix-turn-helix domain-containing protein [Enterocloster bolteae]|uniref:Helix-turn-helix domain-containing protein n=2 Tax=Enterocloster bolteae TaxID=208479 RepID=A0A414AJL8_9FIRM|nr:helix-turn-helix domain-containing protein [Enterocloster bolteae]RHC49152.1 helix-turn-helix domain-containing protein [Enterocloster bolteae]